MMVRLVVVSDGDGGVGRLRWWRWRVDRWCSGEDGSDLDTAAGGRKISPEMGAAPGNGVEKIRLGEFISQFLLVIRCLGAKRKIDVLGVLCCVIRIALRLAKTHDPLALMANSQNPYNYLVFHPDHPSQITYMQHPPPNNNYVPQPSFNTNNIQQPLLNPKDISDPTTTMNMTLVLMIAQPRNQIGYNAGPIAKNQNGYNVVQNVGNQVGQNAVQNPGIQNVGNHNGLIVVPRITNQNVNHNENGNVVAARAEEAGIQLQAEEFDLMAAAGDIDEIKEVNANCILMANLQQASTSGTQTDKALVYDSDGSAEECKYDKISYDKSYNDMQNQIEWFQARLGDLKGQSTNTPGASETLDLLSQNLDDENVSLEFQVLNLVKENEPLKSIYKKLFDFIKQTLAQIKIIIDSLQEKLNDTIYEKAMLRAQLHTKFSKQQNAVDSTSANTKFAKPSILEKPALQPFRNQSVVRQPTAFKSERPKFPKTQFIPKIVEKNDLTKVVTSHSVPKFQESKFMKNDKVNAREMFRINHLNNYRVDNLVPNKNVKVSVRTTSITVSQPHITTKKDVNYNTQKHTSSACNNIKLAIRNDKFEVICATCKQCLITANHDECVFKYVNSMNSSKKNQSANVLESANQKKHQENVKKSKKLGFEESLASPKPSKPRTCLRWLPTGKSFDLCGKITTSSNTESESDISVCDNASASNPQEPTSKGFPNSTSFLSRLSRLRRQNTCLYSLADL
ncbi:hypothetical protein Tco_0257721 [Tanacetum coccineum]